MDTNKILQADVLDIIFDNRNKSYGAYELRKNYSKRVRNALVFTFGLSMLAVSGPTLAGLINGKAAPPPRVLIDSIYKLHTFKIPEKQPKPNQTKTQHPNTTKPPQSNIPPTVIAHVDHDPTPPKPDPTPVTTPTGPTVASIPSGPVSNVPSGPSSPSGIPTPIPIPIADDSPMDFPTNGTMPEYPGGEEALLNHMKEHINYPSRAVSNEITGQVLLSFIINKEGKIEDIKIIKGIGYGCDEEAIRVLKSSSNWKPGTNNGHPVKIFYQIPISFELEDKN